MRWLIIGYEDGEAYADYDFSTFTIDGQRAYVDTTKTIVYTGTNGQPGLLVLSEKVLNISAFGPADSVNQYSNSTLKVTIDRMYGEIFTVSQQEYVKSTTINTTYYDGGLIFSGDTVTTKLFSLGHKSGSYTENYGAQTYLAQGAQMMGVATALVDATGISVSSSTGVTQWWLRSGAYGNTGFIVDFNGYVSNLTVFDIRGVRVACVMSFA